MPETAVAPKKKEEKQSTLPQGQELVEAALPQKPGLERRVKFLWDGHFRVNYQEKYSPYYILDSYFVTIQDGRAIVSGEKPVKKMED